MGAGMASGIRTDAVYPTVRPWWSCSHKSDRLDNLS